jgi:flagellar M-ring protein FliF
VENKVQCDATAALPGDSSRTQKDRREELSNFELSSKKISTVSSGYKVDNLTIAVVVNRRQLVASLGENPPQEAIDRQLKEVERVVQSAAGINEARGDKVTVAAVDFVVDTQRLEPVEGPGIFEQLMRHAGTFINAAAIVIAAFLLVWFGLKPAIRAILEQPQLAVEGPAVPLSLEGEAGAGGVPSLAKPGEVFDPQDEEYGLQRKKRPTPQQALERMVTNNEEAVAALLKQLMRN